MCTNYVVSEHLGTRLEGGHQLPRLLPVCGTLMKDPGARSPCDSELIWPSGYQPIAPRQPGHGMSFGLWEECSTIVQYCLSRDNIESISCSCSSKFTNVTCPANLSSRDQKCLRGHISQVDGSLSIHRVIRKK